MTNLKAKNSKARPTTSNDVTGTRPLQKKSNPKHRKRISKKSSYLGGFDVNVKFMLALSVAAFATLAFSIYRLSNSSDGPIKQRVVVPFPAPKIMDLPQFQGEHRESLYWGTYRPHLYFGIRARTPHSLIAGLMWIGIKDGRYFLRHVCQDSDELTTYGWRKHNGRDYGYQVLVDHDLSLSTSFLKSKGDDSGYGGDWAFRVEVQSNKTEDLEIGHLFFYVAEESRNVVNLSADKRSLHITDSSLLASGHRGDVGNWQIHLHSEDRIDLHYLAFNTIHLHNLSSLVEQNLDSQARKSGRLQLGDEVEDSSNVLVFQLSGRIPFAADVTFMSGTGPDIERRLMGLKGKSLTSQFIEKEKQFDAKFSDAFGPEHEIPSGSSALGKASLANMLGGIGYFFGQSKISHPTESEAGDSFLLYWPAELYTAVPSRPFFPRGFLWDEGFHQLLIWRWDLRISLDIVGHWLDLMNIDGWIPREQILGAEALSKVPEEFVLQYPSNANPPTLFLLLHELISGMKSNRFTSTETAEISAFFQRAVVRLEMWFQWFNATQSGVLKSSYYWHGRDGVTNHELNPKTLSSGFDDYPRASHPGKEERHVDLRLWMLLSADCLHSISEFLGIKTFHDYASEARLLSDFDLLNQMHFDEQSGLYSDFGNHTEKVRLVRRHAGLDLVRDVLEPPRLRFVPHAGCVSLFPFIAKIIPPDSWIIGRQLELISDPSILWTDYGIRSLARTSSLYMKQNTEHDPPYWRGPIWMNMNYLIMSSLHHYSHVDGPYRELAGAVYGELRRNLLRNVVQNYEKGGYLWEQYDPKRGNGKGARLFTGWTALVLLIISENYGQPWSASTY